MDKSNFQDQKYVFFRKQVIEDTIWGKIFYFLKNLNKSLDAMIGDPPPPQVSTELNYETFF